LISVDDLLSLLAGNTPGLAEIVAWQVREERQ